MVEVERWLVEMVVMQTWGGSWRIVGGEMMVRMMDVDGDDDVDDVDDVDDDDDEEEDDGGDDDDGGDGDGGDGGEEAKSTLAPDHSDQTTRIALLTPSRHLPAPLILLVTLLL